MLQRRFDSLSLIDACELVLGGLFESAREYEAFMIRLRDFISSDDTLPRIVNLRGGILGYDSESFVPPRLDPMKPNLFFVVGNPAPQSVALRAMYAHEGGGDGRQHRFWRVMHSTGVLRFSQHEPDVYQPHEKMRRLYAGHYESPFNVHIVPFFSLPSPPGGPWGGVTGLRRLFGKQFQCILSAELAAVCGLIDESAKPGDCVLVFQKDAYMALRKPDAPAYDVSLLRRAEIVSEYLRGSVELVCVPPTRLLYSRVTRSALAALVQRANGSVGVAGL